MNYNKFFWYDTETTGLEPDKHEITQIAGIIVIDGVVKKQFDIKMKPEKVDNISQEALDIQKKTIQELLAYPDRRKGWAEFIRILNNYVNKYDKEDKYIQAGQNVDFDKNFLVAEAKAQKFEYLFSYLHYHKLDTISLGMIAKIIGVLPTENLKLVTMAKYLNVENVDKAHDALYDVQMTRQVASKLIKLITGRK